MINHPGLRRTYPLGVFSDGNQVALIGREKYGTTWRLTLGHGQHGAFHIGASYPSLVLPLGRKEHLSDIESVAVATVLNQRIMTYTVNHDGQKTLKLALYDPQDDMQIWDVFATDHRLSGHGRLVGEYLHEGQYVLYYGKKTINVAFSKTLSSWHTGSNTLAAPRPHHFDAGGLEIVSATYTAAGLFVVYQSVQDRAGKTQVHLGALLCSPTEPDKVVWRSDEPLYSHSGRSKDNLRTLGAIVHERKIVLYLANNREKLVTVELANPYAPHTLAQADMKLQRVKPNPIMSPSSFEWESQAVFNPAAFVDSGRVHLLYRAMGPDGISRIGYASSADGIHFDERLPHPVYTPVHGFGLPESGKIDHTQAKYNPELFPSGGGWAGCEDPRVVSIDGHAYMSFVAFNGWSFMRQALTSISLDDMRNKRWLWKQPTLMSKPGETQKNWVIFPERINGKYAILHGLSPKIHIDYIDSLDQFEDEQFIESLPPAGGAGFHDPGRKQHWDTRVRGAGAPPIKTDIGWLLLYHATDQHDPGKYKLGAMLLDLDDPSKVLYRTNAPILQPDEWYENDGKPGVVYTCGAVIMGENLLVYYGGGDKHIAVARANAKRFIEAVMNNHAIELTRVSTGEMGIM